MRSDAGIRARCNFGWPSGSGKISEPRHTTSGNGTACHACRSVQLGRGVLRALWDRLGFGPRRLFFAG